MNYICTRRQTTLNNGVPRAEAASDELSLPWSKPPVVYIPWRINVSSLVKSAVTVILKPTPRWVGKGEEKEKRSAKACENVMSMTSGCVSNMSYFIPLIDLLVRYATILGAGEGEGDFP